MSDAHTLMISQIVGLLNNMQANGFGRIIEGTSQGTIGYAFDDKEFLITVEER